MKKKRSSVEQIVGVAISTVVVPPSSPPLQLATNSAGPRWELALRWATAILCQIETAWNTKGRL